MYMMQIKELKIILLFNYSLIKEQKSIKTFLFLLDYL
jgi:hypothetical protein